MYVLHKFIALIPARMMKNTNNLANNQLNLRLNGPCKLILDRRIVVSKMVKEFIFGYSIKTGVLTLSWSILALEGINFSLYLTGLLAYGNLENSSQEEQILLFVLTYYLLWSIVGMIVSLLAVKAIKTNNPKLLNGIYWYLCYSSAFNFLRVIVIVILTMIADHATAKDTIENVLFVRFPIHNLATVSAFLYTFWAALLAYFALKVRNFQDKRKRMIKAEMMESSIFADARPSSIQTSPAEQIVGEGEEVKNHTLTNAIAEQVP